MPARVLLPMTMAKIDGGKRQVDVSVDPGRPVRRRARLKNPDQVTLLEEDKITAYFAGGYLYADARAGWSRCCERQRHVEPVRGLPATICPQGETHALAGRARLAALARRALHVRAIAIYFAVLLVVAWPRRLGATAALAPATALARRSGWRRWPLGGIGLLADRLADGPHHGLHRSPTGGW